MVFHDRSIAYLLNDMRPALSLTMLFGKTMRAVAIMRAISMAFTGSTVPYNGVPFTATTGEERTATAWQMER